MDNLLQQLEKRSAERVCFQGPPDLTRPQGDDQLCKRSVIVNGAPNVHNCSAKQFHNTGESVGNVNSSEFLNNEKTQTLNFAKDVGRIKANGSMGMATKQVVDIPSVKNNRQLDSHSKSDVHSGARSPKLEKQDRVDFDHLSASELPDHFPASSTSDSVLSAHWTHTAVVEGNVLSNSGSVNLVDEEPQNGAPPQPFQRDVGDLETASPDKSNSLNNESSAAPGSSKQVQKILRFSDPAITGWKLDRRESGQLFWRRDSSTLDGIDPSSRVKFRYDVDVCEFESRFSETEDLLEEDEEDNEDCANWDSEREMLIKTCEDSSVSDSSGVEVEQTSSMPSSVVCFFAAFAIVVSLLYGWLTYLFFNEQTHQD